MRALLLCRRLAQHALPGSFATSRSLRLVDFVAASVAAKWLSSSAVPLPQDLPPPPANATVAAVLTPPSHVVATSPPAVTDKRAEVVGSVGGERASLPSGSADDAPDVAAAAVHAATDEADMMQQQQGSPNSDEAVATAASATQQAAIMAAAQADTPTERVAAAPDRVAAVVASQSTAAYSTAKEPKTTTTGTTSATAATSQVAPQLDLRRDGLVSTWDDNFYGRELPDPVAAGRLLLAPGLLWAAAEQDAAAASLTAKAYVDLVRDRKSKFFKAEDEDGLPIVVNHEGTLAALRQLEEDEGSGKLILLTGPRSVGKTLMLRKMVAELSQPQHKRRVVYYNARHHGVDLTRGIIASLARNPTFFEKVVHNSKGAVLRVLFSSVADMALPGLGTALTVLQSKIAHDVKAADATGAKSLLDSQPRLDLVLGAFFDACKANGEFPIIIIDEANAAFKVGSRDEAAAARVVAELQLFTSVSKELTQASVVLATSEHGLPFRLRALGFNTDHIDKVIVAEEVPPAVMKDVLIRLWGCGEHLATALLSMYGGHVRHLSAAVGELATMGAAMKGIHALTSIDSAPAACLSEGTLKAAAVPKEDWAATRADVMAALKTLVLKGSYPLDSNEDKVAEIISLANAGVVIPLRAAASGVPRDAWEARTPKGEEPTHILVPSSHIMRLLIARKVFPPPM